MAKYQPTGYLDNTSSYIMTDENGYTPEGVYFGDRILPYVPYDSGAPRAPAAAPAEDPKVTQQNQLLQASQNDAANNLKFAEYATAANRANQYTPYGSLTWERGATPNDPWTQRTSFTPEGQRLFDLDNQLSTKYGETANLGFDRVRGMFENLQLDESKLPQRAINQGQTAQQALLARLEPTLAQEDEALRTRLANQGIGLGSTAYNREMGLQGQKATDMRLQSSMMGINLDNQNRASALDEAYTAQSRPLDLVNALRSGAQVQNPTFGSYAQQATTSGGNSLGVLEGIANRNLQQQTNEATLAQSRANAKSASRDSAMSGLFGLGAAALTGGFF